MSVQLTFCGICYRDHHYPEMLDKAAADGWKYVEMVAMPGAFHIDAREIDGKTLRRDIESRGMKLAAIHAGGLPTFDVERARNQVAYIQRVIDLLAEAGADQLVFTGGPRDKEKLEDLAKAVAQLIPSLEKAKVKLGLENHYKNRIEKLEDYDYLVPELNHPLIGITADMGHFHSSAVDTPHLLRKYKDKIFHVHVKDHKGTQSMALGEGDVDVRGILGVLKEIGYTRAVSVELEVADRENLDRHAHEAFKFLTKKAQEARIA